MANFVYDKARQRFVQGNIAYLTDNIRAQLLAHNAYTFSQTHEFLSSIPVAARVSTSQIMGNKSATNGNVLAGDIAFPAVPSGFNIGSWLMYKDTGSEATSPLIAYIDTFITPSNVYPLPTNGGTINLQFTGLRIFRL